MTDYYSGGGEKTIAKLVILDKYLKSYLDILGKPSNWSGEKWYVDTHSGTGYTYEFDIPIPGSTMRAMSHDFDRYYFYERDENNFETLCDTLADEFDLTFEQEKIQGTSTTMAKCDNPRVRVYNMDCNEGVKWLVNHAGGNSHWFTFIDPEKFSVERELLESLIQRGNMDILFNFQTTGFVRAGSEDAEHSHDKVQRNVGENFPLNASADEWVDWVKTDVFGPSSFDTTSRKMISEGNTSWRYDLIFASASGTAENIMSDIMENEKLTEDISEEVIDWREKSPTSQTGLEFYALEIDKHGAEEDGQATFSSFE